MSPTFWEVITIHILQLCGKSGKCFKEVYEDGWFVKSLEIFWMNNKTIIEFGFRRMIYMKYYADLVGCYPPRST